MNQKKPYFLIFNSCLKVTICFFMLVFFCNNIARTLIVHNNIRVGTSDFNEILPLLENKKVGIVANQTTTINGTHLVDSLLSIGIEIEMVISPEHGFRGKADAGEKVDNEIDPSTENFQVNALKYFTNEKIDEINTYIAFPPNKEFKDFIDQSGFIDTTKYHL